MPKAAQPHSIIYYYPTEIPDRIAVKSEPLISDAGSGS
jgi:hypothetical protein